MSEVKRYRAGNIPEKITRNIFIFARKHSRETEYSIVFSDAEALKNYENYILLGKEEITFRIPKMDLVSAATAELQKKKHRREN